MIKSAIAAFAALASAGVAQAQTPAPSAKPAAPDYRQESAWLCRPGRKDACAVDLDALAITPAGVRTVERFAPAADPKVDCFYVYPTVSAQKGDLADLTIDHEEMAVARVQAARFASRCRLFAPMYRQVTGAGLAKSMQPGGPAADWVTPYLDVRAAWRDYLARSNDGRGVILIGHSQGSILLARLIQNEIEGKPVAARLVSALLAGHPAVAVPQGAEVGGDFKSTPLCRSKAQTGCVVVFASYAEDDNPARRLFGHHPGEGRVAACVNPGAPGGGRARLTAYYPKPKTAPAADPPFIKGVDEYAGECVGDAQGQVLRVHVEPGALEAVSKTAIATIPLARNGWGLHAMDMTINQGALLDLVEAQSAAWRR